jgi:catechol 2,3-dioxygenase-like lactoylglutathione lyase family enzyme
MTRRELLVAIPAVAASGFRTFAQGAPFVTRAMNHVTLTVTDPKRSLEFYQRVFGLPVVANQGPIPILRVGSGPQFIALSGGPKATPRIDHVCLTIENFNADRAMKQLEAAGVLPAAPGRGGAPGGLGGGPLRARIRIRGESAGGAKEGTPELYFDDPDGITTQLQAVNYCGGSGVFGEICSAPAAGRGATTPPIVTLEMNHVTLMVSDIAKSRAFYQKVFGLPVVARQAATEILRVGKGPAFIALGAAGTATPRIDHVCLTVENFDVDRIMSTLASLGIKRADGPAGPLTSRVRMRGAEFGGAKEGTPELYFTDPDGISIQLQDATYCGGSGVRGNVCASG